MQQQHFDGRVIAGAFSPDLKGAFGCGDGNHFYAAIEQIIAAGVVMIFGQYLSAGDGNGCCDAHGRISRQQDDGGG